MKIEIENKDQDNQNDQPEAKEAWREELRQNAAIMGACIDAFPNQSECVWRALFDSIVPSAAQKETTKKGLGMMEAALKLFENGNPEPVVFHGIVPPETFEGGGPAIVGEPAEPPEMTDEEKGEFVAAGLRSMCGAPPSVPRPPTTSDDKLTCCLCGGESLLQVVFLPKGVINSSEDPYICMTCLKKLVEKEYRNVG